MIRHSLFFHTFAPNQTRNPMDNLQFREYLQQKLNELRKLRNTPSCPENYGQQESLLTSALRIMTYSPGPARRRFRRDFERRMKR